MITFPPLEGVVERATGSLALGYLLSALGYVVVSVYGFVGSREVGLGGGGRSGGVGRLGKECGHLLPQTVCV